MAKKSTMTIEKLATLMQEGFENLTGGFENLNEKVDVLSRDMTSVKRDIAEIKVDIKAHGKAIDKDATVLINHETRIKKLERSV